jgi:carnitine-CoA ligase
MNDGAIMTGKPETNEKPETLADALRNLAAAHPGQPFVKCGGLWLTASELDRRSDRIAAGLARRGITHGDRIAYLVPNRQEFLELFFASAKLGGVNVTLNYWLRGEFLRHQLCESGASMLIADAPGQRAAAPWLADTDVRTVVLLDASDEKGADQTEEIVTFDDLVTDNLTPPATTLAAADPLAMVYTSGTTGLSKGCVLPNGYYIAAGRALGQSWCRPHERIITACPLFHATGQTICLMMALMCEGSVCFEPSFSASGFMRRAAEERATFAFGVGPMGMAILAQPPAPSDTEHSLRLGVFPPMPVAAQAKFEERFATPVICEAYGQTECQPITISGLSGPRKRSTSGRAAPHLEVKVVDHADRELPVGEVGEVVLRPRQPNSMFSGYWRRPEATVEASRNLWHHTGDSGYFDADGFFTFADRKTDSLRRHGENISSVELEFVIAQHDKVARCAVVAVPSPLGDDDIKACIVCEQGQKLTPEELFDHCKAGLPYFAIPRYVEVRDSLPLTNATERVQKHVLRAEGITPTTWDYLALGLAVPRDQRRN